MLGCQKIHVDSFEGVGSTFSFSIPIYFEQSSPSEVSENSLSSLINDIHKEADVKESVLEFSGKTITSCHIDHCKCKMILVVDDNDYNLFTMKRKLTRRGYEVITAYNGQQCIEQVIEYEKGWKKCGSGCRGIRLILMDVDMPIMNGIEATKELQRLMKKKEISPVTIVGCSAFESKQDIMEGLNAGMKDYITKPVLDSKLEQVLKVYTLSLIHI
eukprot:TRINITY_DN7368_c0_g3_i2.p1 TRINITY_DN7368_c0_g3~~TRINITY_DN7368_c0_g3_i2.p1  ORF type:complete len:215 (-),score=12.80 TRINITY_DN7368_c0_g3_i2:63-707(-)